MMEIHTGRIDFQDQKFSYTEDGKTEIMLDCQDYFANKSRISMHSFAEDQITVPKLLLGLAGQYDELSKGTGEEENSAEILLITVEIVSKLIRSALPVKAAELGCTSGVLSYYLAQVLGIFNPESSLCCVTDVIGNSSENCWLDRISLAENLPKLSMLAADYDNTQLESGYFDVVVINGTNHFGDPNAVILEAKRLVKKEGLILAYCCDSPLLENCFRLNFPERREYHLQVNTRIMAAKRTWEDTGESLISVWENEVKQYLEQVQKMMEKEPDSGMVIQASQTIDQYVRDAMDMGALQWKVRLIGIKELLLDYQFGSKTYVREKIERVWPL